MFSLLSKAVISVFIAAVVVFTACFDDSSDSSSASGGSETPCTYVVPDYGWHGLYYLNTSDPISSSGNYYYDMYCTDVIAGKTYALQLRSPNGYWIGLSVWRADGSEDEVEYINSNASTPRYRVGETTGTARFSVWIHKDELAGGSAGYQFYLMEQ